MGGAKSKEYFLENSCLQAVPHNHPNLVVPFFLNSLASIKAGIKSGKTICPITFSQFPPVQENTVVVRFTFAWANRITVGYGNSCQTR